MKKNVFLLTALTLGLSLILSGCGLVVLGDPTPAGIPDEKLISEKDAQEIVADHFSLDLEQCIVSKSELDEGKYEIELIFENKEYEAEVNARSGEILEASVEKTDRH